MKAATLTEETQVKTNLKVLWFLGFAVFVVSSFVVLTGYRVNELEAKAATLDQTVSSIDKDRMERREAIMSALSDIKSELTEVKTEIRLMRNDRR